MKKSNKGGRIRAIGSNAPTNRLFPKAFNTMWRIDFQGAMVIILRGMEPEKSCGLISVLYKTAEG